MNHEKRKETEKRRKPPKKKRQLYQGIKLVNSQDYYWLAVITGVWFGD